MIRYLLAGFLLGITSTFGADPVTDNSLPVAAPVTAWDDIIAKAAVAPETGYSMEKSALKGREVLKAYYATYAGWKAPEVPVLSDGRLHNLADKPTAPRFPLADKDWPTKPGDASVCLWEDDKVAAASFGIDDNNATNIPGWEIISKRYGGLNITWNLITDNIDGAIDPAPGRVAQSGTWKLWNEMLAKGWHIESHTVTHVGDPVFEDGWPGPDWEAAESIKQLDDHLPGHKTKLFTPSGSAYQPFNIAGRWRSSMVKYYAGARGYSGIAISPANQIDYFDIRTTAHPEHLFDTDPKSAEGNFTNILNADPASPYHKYYRGWATVFIHALGAKGDDIENDPNPNIASFAKVFDFYNKNRENIWVGFIDDVALYGQERDTATLSTTEATDSKISLKLTDKMDLAVFDYPLTVKVRLPDSWKDVKATQNGKDIPVQVIQHEGA